MLQGLGYKGKVLPFSGLDVKQTRKGKHLKDYDWMDTLQNISEKSKCGNSFLPEGEHYGQTSLRRENDYV